jgi:hypothetical protein
MKVFLSYGHDRNTELVQRIRADLERAGHEVWIDTARIKGGDDWRRTILDGLRDSNWTLSFLSAHSVRDPGVCLDEIGIALGVKGGALATVLVEPEREVQVPVSISHIQWLDMADWTARKTAGGPAWETWYAERLQEILSLLADPKTQRFVGEVEELARRLRPTEQAADIPPLIEGFVGRDWLLQQLQTWRMDQGRGYA